LSAADQGHEPLQEIEASRRGFALDEERRAALATGVVRGELPRVSIVHLRRPRHRPVAVDATRGLLDEIVGASGPMLGEGVRGALLERDGSGEAIARALELPSRARDAFGRPRGECGDDGLGVELGVTERSLPTLLRFVGLAVGFPLLADPHLELLSIGRVASCRSRRPLRGSLVGLRGFVPRPLELGFDLDRRTSVEKGRALVATLRHLATNPLAVLDEPALTLARLHQAHPLLLDSRPQLGELLLEPAEVFEPDTAGLDRIAELGREGVVKGTTEVALELRLGRP
jgi:hypothetical protein